MQSHEEKVDSRGGLCYRRRFPTALPSPKDFYRQRKQRKEEWLTNFLDAVVAIQRRVSANASRQPRNPPLLLGIF
jgi:hypothetical protein